MGLNRAGARPATVKLALECLEMRNLPNNLTPSALFPDLAPANTALTTPANDVIFGGSADSSTMLSGLATAAPARYSAAGAQQWANQLPNSTVTALAGNAPAPAPAAPLAPADLLFQSVLADPSAGSFSAGLFGNPLQATPPPPASPTPAAKAPTPPNYAAAVPASPSVSPGSSSPAPVGGTAPIPAVANGADATFASSPSFALAAAAPQTATLTGLSSSVNPSAPGQAVTFTANVGSSGGTPTGTVTFMDGTTSLGTATLTAAQASFTTSSLSTGNHTITAVYSGDATFAASTSSALTQTVQLTATNTSLSSSVNPSAPGQAVTFTANVSSPSGGTPTGTVTFMDGTTSLGTATLTAAQATFTSSSLSTGNHTITAVYSGDATFAGSTSSALAQTVTDPTPVVANPGGQSDVVGDQVFLPINASVSDGDVLTYSATGLPNGLSIDPGSGYITGQIAVGADNGSPYSVTATASDGTNSASQAFAWTVTHFAIANPGDQTNAIGDSVYVSTGGSDPDGDTLTFSAGGLPPGLSINSTSGLITGTITAGADAGSPYAVTLTASDGAHTASQTFNWTVTHVFVVNPGSQRNADGDSVILPINAGDNDGDPVTVTAGGLPPGLSINAANNIVGTISSTADVGSPYSVTVSASDGAHSASQTFQWTVSHILVANPGDQTNYDGDTVSLQISATDNTSETVTYSAGGLPPGLSVNSATGLISGTVAATADVGGPYSTTVTATGGGASSSQTFTWTINNPVSISPLFDQTNALGDVVSLAVSATTRTGHSLSYSAGGLPPGVSINSSTGLISGVIANTASITTPYSVTVTANDGAISASASFVWTVGRLTLAKPGDQTNASGDTVSLALTASDNAGDTLSYAATGLPPGLSINTTTGLLSGTISLNADASGPYTVTASVTGGGATASQTFTWNVWRIVITDPGTQNNADNDAVTLQISATDHNPGALTYGATGLPPGLSLNATTGLISGTIASTADLNGPYSVTVTASDGYGHSASDTFSWSVTQLTLDNPGTQLNADGDTVTLPLTAAGPSGVALTYTAVGLPPGLNLNTATGVISGLLSMTADVGSPYTVTATAADGKGASASKTFTWNIAQITLANPGDQTYAANQVVSLALHADDNVGGAVTFSATGLPTGLSLSGNNIVGTVPAADVSATAYTVVATVYGPVGQTAVATVQFLIRVLSYTVTFDDPPVITGFLMVNGHPADLPEQPFPNLGVPIPGGFSGHISDLSQIPNIQFVPTGHPDEISLGQLHWSQGIPGLFWEKVNGRIATPVASPHGDTYMEARDHGVVKARVPVIVVVPSAIRATVARRATPTTPARLARPLPQANEIVHGSAQAMNRDTPFPWFTVTAPRVYLATIYVVPMEVPVLDQFGDPLSDIYVGASVSEKWGPTANVFRSIHRELQVGDHGVFYLDPVGGIQTYYNQNGLPILTTNPVDPGLNTPTRTAIAAFLALNGGRGQTLKQIENGTQNIQIQIGGILLVHGVTNRIFSVTPNGNDAHVTVDWHNP